MEVEEGRGHRRARRGGLGRASRGGPRWGLEVRPREGGEERGSPGSVTAHRLRVRSRAFDLDRSRRLAEHE